MIYCMLPSGKLSHNYGKSQFVLGKSSISMAIFSSKLLVYQRVAGCFLQVQVGLCAKLSDAAVAELAQSIIARLHKLAKQERPLWVTWWRPA